jgi:hypothetical protein
MTALLDLFENLPVTLHVLSTGDHTLVVTRAGAQRMGFDTAWDLLGYLQSRHLCVCVPIGESGMNLLNITLSAQHAILHEGGFLYRMASGELFISQEEWANA